MLAWLVASEAFETTAASLAAMVTMGLFWIEEPTIATTLAVGLAYRMSASTNLAGQLVLGCLTLAELSMVKAARTMEVETMTLASMPVEHRMRSAY